MRIEKFTSLSLHAIYSAGLSFPYQLHYQITTASTIRSNGVLCGEIVETLVQVHWCSGQTCLLCVNCSIPVYAHL